jgi:hypothetical protein
MTSRTTGAASAMSTHGRTPRTGPARAGIAVLLCCCAGLTATACSGGPSAKKTDTGVTTPSVGKPPMASSIAAALARQAFTPYAELGDIAGDGLAPNEAVSSLGAACLTDAGYPNDAGDLPEREQVGDTLTGTTVFGAFGYVGTTQAAQDGFVPGGLGGPGPSNVSDAAQAATAKCSTIMENFGVAQQHSSLAGIQTLGQTIRSDEFKDPSIAKATKAWSACMSTNGYDDSNPATLTLNEEHLLPSTLNTGSSLTTAQNAAQVAVAEADAACTQSTDLAGIYFAVQASYEQQIVDANQQQLNTAVRQYRAAYAEELGKLRTLLATTPTTPPSHGPKG